MESVMSAVAQLDNDVRAERTTAGMKSAIQTGKWTFRAPLGYLTGDGRKGSPSLIHDEERGALVKQAFQLCATGLHTTQKILETVTVAGLRTLRGKPVSKQTFTQMLRNPVYAGWVQVEGWGDRQRGDFEPLVNQELFDTVQSVLSGKSASVTPHLRSHPDFPLRHFVKCGCCGKPLTASWSKGRSRRYAFYRCPNPRCHGVSVTKNDLENQFVSYLERIQPKAQFLKLFNDIVLDVWKEKQVQNFTLTASLRHHLVKLNQRKEQLDESFIYDKTIDRETYDRLRDKVNEQILLAEMKEHDAKLEGCDVEGVLAFATQVIQNAARLWTEFSSEQKQRLQKVLFPEGVTFVNGEFGTVVMCPIFNLLEKSDGEKSKMGWPTGLEPATASSTSLDSTIEL